LEWTDAAPTDLNAEQSVEVTIVSSPTDSDVVARGRRMVEILERLAAMNAFSEISDPSEWQREIRKDRPLPGRET